MCGWGVRACGIATRIATRNKCHVDGLDTKQRQRTARKKQTCSSWFLEMKTLQQAVTSSTFCTIIMLPPCENDVSDYSIESNSFSAVAYIANSGLVLDEMKSQKGIFGPSNCFGNISNQTRTTNTHCGQQPQPTKYLEDVKQREPERGKLLQSRAQCALLKTPSNHKPPK